MPELNKITESDVITAARKYLGVRWKHQGRSKDGIDCVGLGILVAHDLNQSDFDVVNYERVAKDETMIELCNNLLIPTDKLSVGNYIVMKFGVQRHMGIIGDYPYDNEFSLIHAHAVNKKVVEHRLDTLWFNRIICSFKLPGVP